MSIFDSIERLQRAPVRKRKIILGLSVACIMMIVVGMWILQLKNQFSQGSSGASSSSLLTPFQVVWETFKENVRDMVNQIKQ